MPTRPHWPAIGGEMDQINPLFTATATAIGGRKGHTETSDGLVKANLSVPKTMGGPGKPDTATPEHLFGSNPLPSSEESCELRYRRRSWAPLRGKQRIRSLFG